MDMKIDRILCVVAAVALPELALADLPFTGQALGTVQGTVDFCAKIKPDVAKKYQEFAKRMVQDIPEEEVSKVRDTDEYQAAYEEVSRALAEVPKHQAAESCASALEQDQRS